MRISFLALAAASLSAATPQHQPRGAPHWPGCAEIRKDISSAHEQSAASAFCSWYLPKTAERTVITTATTTLRTATTVLTTTTVPASTVTITSCSTPTIPPTKKKRAASPTAKPDAWSSYPFGPWISSACSCLRSTTTVTVTSTSITTTVHSTETVREGVTTINAVSTFSVYETPTVGQPGFLFDIGVGNEPGHGNATPSWNIDTYTMYPPDTTYKILTNGSLAIVEGQDNSILGDSGAIAYITPDSYVPGAYSNQVFFLTSYDHGNAHHASFITCSVTPSLDGTCPMTCTVDGNSVAYASSEQYILIGTAAQAAANGGPLALFAIGSAS